MCKITDDIDYEWDDLKNSRNYGYYSYSMCM